jgi:diguanylate cyclase (GGDEF)-like protein/PAS domain S-box-containing protein
VQKLPGEKNTMPFHPKDDNKDSRDNTVTAGDITQREQAEGRMIRQSESLQFFVYSLEEIHRLSITNYASYNALLYDYLKTGSELFHLPIGIVSEIRGSEYEIRAVYSNLDLKPGQLFELKDTYCSAVVEKEKTVAYSHVGSLPEMRSHPVYKNMKLESYLAAPIVVHEQIYGTLNFSSPEVRADFKPEEKRIIEIMAHDIGKFIEADFSEKKRHKTETSLRESQEKFHGIAAAAYDAIVMVDNDGHISFWNKAAERIFGYEEKESFGQNMHELLAPPEYYDEAEEAFSRWQTTGRGPVIGSTRELAALRKDGVKIPVELSLSSVKVSDQWHAIGMIRDISLRKETEERVIHLSLHDNLTDLPNRNLLMERIQQALPLAKRQSKKVAILYIDLDKFKPINDTFGHQAGDKALKIAAEKMKLCVRESDTIARVGGDEFVIVLQEITGPEDAKVVANKVIKEICSPFYIDDNRCELGASVGMSLYPDHGEDTDTIIKNADEAMYQAKKRGGNNFHLYRPGDDE